jgi:PAS domain S-box-containing protein
VEQAAEKEPDLILMDIKLQGEMDGVAAAGEIRARFDIPVIYLTGYTDRRTLERAKLTESFGYILKPFRVKDLQIAIEMALYKHRVESRLRESEERYRIVSELVADYVYVAAVEADGRIAPQWITPAFTRITGFTLDELETAGSLENLVYPDDVPIFVQRTQNLLSGQPDVSEFRIITESGDIRWVCSYARPVWDESRGRVVRIYGAVQDITERKWAEEWLREYSERLEEMVKERTAEVQAQYARLDAILRSVFDGQGNILQTRPVAQAWFTRTLLPEEADQLREMVRDVATRTERQWVKLLELTALTRN